VGDRVKGGGGRGPQRRCSRSSQPRTQAHTPKCECGESEARAPRPPRKALPSCSICTISSYDTDASVQFGARHCPVCVCSCPYVQYHISRHMSSAVWCLWCSGVQFVLSRAVWCEGLSGVCVQMAIDATPMLHAAI